MEWDYEAEGDDSALTALIDAGFKEVVASPSVVFCRYRFFPTKTAFSNVDRMTRHAARHKLAGVMNTAWCPYRYISGSLYYAVAYGAFLLENEGEMDIREFRGKFAEYMFGVALDDSLDAFLDIWPELNITGELAKKLLGETHGMSDEDVRELEKINSLGLLALKNAEKFEPSKNHDIWRAMVLSARIAWICSESHFAANGADSNRSRGFRGELEAVIAEAEAEWDRTRYPDDPLKFKSHFNESASSYLLLILRELRERTAEF